MVILVGKGGRCFVVPSCFSHRYLRYLGKCSAVKQYFCCGWFHLSYELDVLFMCRIPSVVSIQTQGQALQILLYGSLYCKIIMSLCLAICLKDEEQGTDFIESVKHSGLLKAGSYTHLISVL